MSQNWTKEQYRDHIARRLKQEQHERANNFMGAVETRRPERNQISSLDGSVKARRQRTGSVVACITIVAYRHRELDDDSAVFAAKPLRDAIAASLGIDDGDARINWQYGQQITRGKEGVIVTIERV